MPDVGATAFGLQKAGVARRSEALFRALNSDFLLREQFVTDPTHLFFEYVNGEKLDPETSAATNHLIYAFMSHTGLLHWYHEYLRRHLGRPPEIGVFLQDFVKAVAAQRASDVVAALTRNAMAGQRTLGFTAEYPFFTIDDGILARGMLCHDRSVTPDTGPTTQSTETGPTTQSTDTSPTTQSTDTSPTTPSTDTGSGGFAFTGVDIWSQPLNALADYAAHLRTSGALGERVFER